MQLDTLSLMTSFGSRHHRDSCLTFEGSIYFRPMWYQVCHYLFREVDLDFTPFPPYFLLLDTAVFRCSLPVFSAHICKLAKIKTG